MNSVNIIGRLTADPTIRYAGNGSTIAQFTVAVDRAYKKEGQPSADFIRCVAFSKTAELIEKWFSKGRQIGITGRIQTGSYQNNNGDTVYTTDIMIENITFVGNKNDGDGNQAKYSMDTSFMDVNEDELPFQ